MSPGIAESDVEKATLEWFAGLGYDVAYGPELVSGADAAERRGYGDVVLAGRLRAAFDRLNPDIPPEALEDAFRKVGHPESAVLTVNNHAFHRMLTDGVQVEHRVADGRVVGDRVRLVDFEQPEANDWLVTNQFTVVEGGRKRRADVVAFVNGLPLAVVELKDPSDEQATVWNAFNQIQTYKNDIPSLFAYNEVLVISDGLEARVGSLTADRERFMPWRTIEGEDLAPPGLPQLQVVIQGVFERSRFLDLLRHFIVFETDGPDVSKKLAGYHQFHAVNRAVEETIRAARLRAGYGMAAEREPAYEAGARIGSEAGDRRIGVVWHTQGSGKSLTMAFYAGKVVQHPAMANPTIVVLTDRNDLDSQLFDSFALDQELLRQAPVRAESREHLRVLLRVASGGVVFTTIQKFFPEEKGAHLAALSERRNIVVMADEAHRSQYDFIDGFARHMRDALPNASFIGFTGTPIELADRNTRAVFGDYISVYDVQRAQEDHFTVPIYYESRLAQLALREEEKPRVDREFEEVTEQQEETAKERLKSRWAALEALVGTDKRIDMVTRDLVEHFERRLEAMDGKAMVVCMSRRICVQLYDAIMRLRPEWHDDDDRRGVVKVVMTGSADDAAEWQRHIRNKKRREELAKRFKDSEDPFKLVIVRDMWLTGFDAPCLHTMYVDKPMRGHNLMQAIARVNRVFRDKPGGLVVDYLGLAPQLQEAVADYTASGGRGKAVVNQQEAVAIMLERYEVCRDMFHGFDYSGFLTGMPVQRLSILPGAQEHILAQENGRERFLTAVSALTKAFALAVPEAATLRIRDEVGFFQTVRAALAKTTRGAGAEEEMEHAIRQIVSGALVSDKVIDVFAAAGLKKPDISVLSDEFLAEVRGMTQKNLAVELLRKLLNDEIRIRSRKFLVQSRSFADKLEQAVRAYHNRAISSAQVIEELVAIAKEMSEARTRGEKLFLSDDELAFYDALEVNDSAVKVLGDETLRAIARELVDTVRRNVTIDWAVKQSVKARLRVLTKRILRRYGYPPDKQEKATKTVLDQAELLSGEWMPTE